MSKEKFLLRRRVEKSFTWSAIVEPTWYVLKYFFKNNVIFKNKRFTKMPLIQRIRRKHLGKTQMLFGKSHCHELDMSCL